MSAPEHHRAKNLKSNNPVDAEAFLYQIRRRERIASGYRLGFWPQPLFKVSRKILDTESVIPHQVQKIETLPEEVLSQICDHLTQIETESGTEPDDQSNNTTTTTTTTSAAINFALACKAFAKAFNYRIRADVDRRVNSTINALIDTQLAGTHRYCDQCDLWRSTDHDFWMQVIDFTWANVLQIVFNTNSVHTTVWQIDSKKEEIDSWVDAWCQSSLSSPSMAAAAAAAAAGCCKSSDGQQARSGDYCSRSHSYLTPTIFYSSCPGHFAHRLLRHAAAAAATSTTTTTTAILKLEEFWAKCEQRIGKPGLSTASCSCKMDPGIEQNH